MKGREEAWTDWPCFEALFEHLERPTGAYAEALRCAGFDATAPRPRYPTPVWGRCVGLAREHFFPALPEAQGFRQLAQHYTRAFSATVLGRFMLGALPPMSPEDVVQRVPRYWGMTSTGARVELVPVAERHWRLEVDEPHVPREFVAGVLEITLRMACARGLVTVGEQDGAHYVLHFQW